MWRSSLRRGRLTRPGGEANAAPSRRRTTDLLSLGVWVGGFAALAVQLRLIQQNPSLHESLLGALIACVAASAVVNRALHAALWRRRMRWAGEYAKSLEFVSADIDMPNRNHVLFELRTAMPEARASGRTFVLAEIALSSPGGEASVPVPGRQQLERKLTDILKGVTRQTDLLAEVSAGKYCVVLLECTAEQSGHYLKRLPQTISTIHEGVLATAGVAVRLLEYDMETMFATDMLGELSRQPQIQRRSTNAEQRRTARRRAFARPARVVSRGVLEQFLREHYRIASRHNLPLSVAAITVANMADVRATYGKPSARLVLRQVATLVAQTTRPADLVASLGSDQLAVVFPGLTRPQAQAALAELDAEVAKTQFRIAGHGSVELALLAGVAELCSSEATSPERMLARAELALQEATGALALRCHVETLGRAG